MKYYFIKLELLKLNNKMYLLYKYNLYYNMKYYFIKLDLLKLNGKMYLLYINNLYIII